jgi:hypothetical protein
MNELIEERQNEGIMGGEVRAKLIQTNNGRSRNNSTQQDRLTMSAD